MQPQPPTQQQPGAQPGAPQQGLTPDQMKKMQLMSKQAMSVLLEDNTANGIVQRARGGHPEQVVCDTVLAVMSKLYEAASAAGQQVDEVTMMVTGIQIIGDLTEMLAAGGVLPDDPQVQQQFVARVAKMTVDKHNATVQQQGGQPAQPQQGGV